MMPRAQLEVGQLPIAAKHFNCSMIDEPFNSNWYVTNIVVAEESSKIKAIFNLLNQVIF